MRDFLEAYEFLVSSVWHLPMPEWVAAGRREASILSFCPVMD